MNYKMIRNILGWILIFESIFMLVPLITAIAFGEKEWLSFVICMAICLAVGLLLSFRKAKDTVLYSREGFVIVAASWIILSIFGALPFVIAGSIPSFVDAVFETVSGFTTTGASILSDVEMLPKSILMWRSFTHWVGGMGVLVFIMAFVPLSGGQNMHIMKAESPGPSVSKLVPKVKTTATILYVMYFALTILEFIVLLCGGMNVFEALNTSFATAGTGGFGIRNNSMAGFSPFLQNAVTVFMLLFSINFTSYYLILTKKIKDAFNTEVRVFVVIVVIAIASITLNVSGLYDTIWETLRHSAFTVATIISTTGFSTANFDLWPTLSKTIIVLLMFIGACAGSTGGGIKVSRLIIVIKSIGNEIKRLVHPKQVKQIFLDGKIVPDETVRSVLAYMAAFAGVFIVSLVLLSLEGYDLVTNFTAVAATINNIGPGLSLVGPSANFAFFSDGSKIVLIFDMLAGRLELFPMLVLFSRATWKR